MLSSDVLVLVYHRLPTTDSSSAAGGTAKYGGLAAKTLPVMVCSAVVHYGEPIGVPLKTTQKV